MRAVAVLLGLVLIASLAADEPMEARLYQGRPLADWLAGQPGVQRVLYPGRPDHPDHVLARTLMEGFFAALPSLEPTLLRRIIERGLNGVRPYGRGISWASDRAEGSDPIAARGNAHGQRWTSSSISTARWSTRSRG